MYGLFHSHVTIGNTSFNKILSITRTPLNIFKSSGQRVFVQQNGHWQLLGMPSAYEIGRDFVRWLYKTEHGSIDVKAWVSPNAPVGYLSIHTDIPRVFLISHHVVLDHAEWESCGEIVIDADNAMVQLLPGADTSMTREYPEAVFYLAAARGERLQTIGGDELLFADGQTRGLPYVVFQTKPVTEVTLLMTGSVLDAQSARERCQAAQHQGVDFEADMAQGRPFWLELANGFALQAPAHQVGKIQDIISWYLHNGMIHYTTPHGLEQYTGAAWGVRDVCQGPVELLLATRHYAYVKDIIKTVFAQQYEDTADWPQWFMFDRYVKIQHAESHGDIIVWPLKALASYIEASNNFGILEEIIPYTDRTSFDFTDSKATLFEHVTKAIEAIEQRFIPQTYLSCYGAGDWNDTLQPADPSMRENMVSAWTVSLTYQVLRQLGRVLQLAGQVEWAIKLSTLCHHIQEDFNTYLVKDDVVCGLAYFHDFGRIDHMLHPSDNQTHISYRLLPMTRSIIGELFRPVQMRHHVAIIDQHLAFPDGVRLMDRPVQYRGGVREFFRRAEESANFGRETGLQYVHAHLRYIEALCKSGHAKKAFEAILTIIPITLNDQVETALPRQSNAYFSSSDADFKDRYDASANFSKIKSLQVGVKGGWRIYSSGPGIFIHQIICHFLGLRDSFGHVVIDPVLPRELDGLSVQFKYGEAHVTYHYHIQNDVDFEVQQITINGREVAFTFDDNPYRRGGAMMPQMEFQRWLTQANNRVEVSIG
jgi:cellobiose phosphorylase